MHDFKLEWETWTITYVIKFNRFNKDKVMNLWTIGNRTCCQVLPMCIALLCPRWYVCMDIRTFDVNVCSVIAQTSVSDLRVNKSNIWLFSNFFFYTLRLKSSYEFAHSCIKFNSSKQSIFSHSYCEIITFLKERLRVWLLNEHLSWYLNLI